MSRDKVCVECQKTYESRSREGTQDYAKQKFCTQACSYKFRKRARHKQAMPPAVAAEAERQGVVQENPYNTITFRRLDPTHGFNEVFLRKDKY